MPAVGALLENEAISGLSEGKQMGFRRASTGPSEVIWTPDDLIAIVSCFLYQYHCHFKKLLNICSALCHIWLVRESTYKVNWKKNFPQSRSDQLH